MNGKALRAPVEFGISSRSNVAPLFAMGVRGKGRRSILSAARSFLARGLLLCAIVGRQLLRQFEIVVDQNVGGNARYPCILQQDFNRRLTLAYLPERDAGEVAVSGHTQRAN